MNVTHNAMQHPMIHLYLYLIPRPYFKALQSAHHCILPAPLARLTLDELERRIQCLHRINGHMVVAAVGVQL